MKQCTPTPTPTLALALALALTLALTMRTGAADASKCLAACCRVAVRAYRGDVREIYAGIDGRYAGDMREICCRAAVRAACRPGRSRPSGPGQG